MNRASRLRSILRLISTAQAERHVLGEEIGKAELAGEAVFGSDEELSIIAEINGRLGNELNVYAGILTNLVGDPDAITDEKTRILYAAQQEAAKCQCAPCVKLRKSSAS